MLEISTKTTFPTDYRSIQELIDRIDPVAYGRSRNYIDGAVTHLSPYISRGVISTRIVLEQVLNRGFDPATIEKFIQELAWRDYWQQLWIAHGDGINQDLRWPQPEVKQHAMPAALIQAQTGIEGIDQAIEEFYDTGYLHNHVRMYIASIACNIAGSHWSLPARWMYYHLLDADWASNTLSWQWVAGSNSRKKYYANQENINKYCRTEQRGTFLDVSYDQFGHLPVPEELQTNMLPELATPLLETPMPGIQEDQPTLLYTLYNMDPNWRSNEAANRVLILEPEHFRKYPVSGKTIGFVQDLGENIPDLQVYVGSFENLSTAYPETNFIYKEHPFNHHFKGTEDPRDWMFSVTGSFNSFFAFWKKCKKEL